MKYITTEIKKDLFGDLDVFDAGVLALYSTFAGTLLALALYAIVVAI